MKDPLSRFSVSLSSSLLNDLDAMAKQRGYASRSLVIANLIRDALVRQREETGKDIAGTITLVYDHHRPGIQDKLTSLQHDFMHDVISTMHVHLDHDNCLEVVVVRGKAKDVKKLADGLITAKGVKHGKLTVTSIGSDLAV